MLAARSRTLLGRLDRRLATLLRAVRRAGLDDAAVTPIYFFVSKNLVNPAITGWKDNIVNWHRVQYLCRGR